MLELTDEIPNDCRYNEDMAILKKTETVVGYNLFNMPELSEGHHYLTSEKLELINQTLAKHGLSTLKEEINPLYVGEIIEFDNITDKAKLVWVNIGKKTIKIVSTASNIARGQKVVVALPGAVLYNGDIIRESELYDQLSQGVFVSKRSLWGINEDLGMILTLPPESETGVIFKETTNKEDR